MNFALYTRKNNNKILKRRIVTGKLIAKIASTQEFIRDDKLGQMVTQYSQNEINCESLDMVYAARKDNMSFEEFKKLVLEREKK
jgi:hypothetical protein